MTIFSIVGIVAFAFVALCLLGVLIQILSASGHAKTSRSCRVFTEKGKTMSKPQFSLTITPDQFTKLSQQLQAQGVVQPGATSGSLPETQGVQIDFAVTDQQPAAVTIEFTVNQKPWVVSVGMIESHVKGMIPA